MTKELLHVGGPGFKYYALWRNIYVQLFEEGTKVYRPVPAIEIEPNIFKVQGVEIYGASYAVPVVGIVYGGDQFASYLYNGKSIEESVAKSRGY